MRVWRKSKSLTFLSASVIILEFLQCFALAGPVKRSSRLIREVYPEIEQEKLEGNQAEVCIVGDVVYGAEEPVPADQPCLKCKCEPPGVQCETTRCIKKPGCRAIHKPNECCPEYQCECEYEGRIYANGQRLETPPGGECRVCYCRGGEVQCAEVSCYIRTDCEGRRVPGQCCPKYDHCPPRDSLIDRILPFTTQSPLTSYANSVDYWTTSNASVKDPLTTSLYNVQEINESNNQITETLTQPTQIQQTIDDLNKIHIHEVKLVDGGSQTDPLDDETAKQIFINGQAAHRNKTAEVREEPRITIQEIIPEIKEIPITGPPKREINLKIHSQQLDDSIELKSLNKVDPTENKDLDLGDAESDSSEISEIYHHPPPVLKIGDQLLFLKKGELVPSADVSTPLPVITIIGAEGLQRGTEDSAESHDVNSQVQEPQTVILNSLQENETESTSVFPSSNIISLLKTKLTIDTTTPSVLSTIEDFPINITDLESEISDSPLSNEKLNDTVATEDTINKTNAENTTTATEELNLQVLAADVNETDLDVSTVGALSEDNSVSDPTENLGTDDSASAYSETITIYERLQSSSSSTPVEEELFNVTESSSFESTPKYESVSEVAKLRQEEEVLIDQNPEYPPIPDIMSPQHVFEMPEHLDTEVMPTNSDNLLINTSSTVANEVETTTPNFIQLNETVTTSHPLINGRAALPPALLDISAPSDHLSDSLTEESQEIQSIILNHDGNITINTTDFLTEVTPTEVDRSKETMEESVSVESDEMVTEANKQASVMLSVEDASVETTHKLDTTDLVENITGLQRNVKEIDHNVTLFSTVTPVLRDDVELIDPKVSITDLKTKENSTITKDNRKTWLNENDNEAEDIFSQLNKELKSTPAHIKHKAGDADSEAEAIFRELLEEATSSTLSPDNNSKNEKSTSNDKESVLLQRVSEAISKFQGKESKESLDTSILGILKDFFSSQYKYYTTKK